MCTIGYLQFGSIDFPLRSLHFKPGPFMLDEMQDARNGVLSPGTGVITGLAGDADGCRGGSQLPIMGSRRTVLFHCARTALARHLHDMASASIPQSNNAASERASERPSCHGQPTNRYSRSQTSEQPSTLAFNTTNYLPFTSNLLTPIFKKKL